ncbi:hypothetical protein D3C87_1257920 [compost metagenome]
MSNPACDPEKPDVKVDTVSAVRRQGARDFTIDQPETVEASDGCVTQKPHAYDFGGLAEKISDEPVRSRICRLGVDKLQTVSKRLIEQSLDAFWILLPIFVHGDHPVAGCARHAGHRGGMLPVIAGQPYRVNERIFFCERADHDIRTIRPAIVNEQYFANKKFSPSRRFLRQGEFFNLRNQGGKRLLARINGDDDRDSLRIIHCNTSLARLSTELLQFIFPARQRESQKFNRPNKLPPSFQSQKLTSRLAMLLQFCRNLRRESPARPPPA